MRGLAAEAVPVYSTLAKTAVHLFLGYLTCWRKVEALCTSSRACAQPLSLASALADYCSDVVPLARATTESGNPMAHGMLHFDLSDHIRGKRQPNVHI